MARKLQIIGVLGGTGSQNVELDTTLTVEGKAADAKAVGDALENKLNAVMVSPDGSRWRVSIGNDGVLTSEKIIVEIPATGIALSASTLTFNSSASQTIKAILTPADSTDVVVWDSNNDNVATVSNNGVVTPVSNGSCIITAGAGAVSASCAITVDVAVVETYSITRNITNATGFDDSTAIGAGSELLECYISNDECTMDGATATVTMGGVDITATAWDNGVVNIAEVTGDVVITLDAVQIQYATPTISDFAYQIQNNKALIGAYSGAETAIVIPDTMDVEGNTYPVQLRWDFNPGDSVKHLKVSSGVTKWSSFSGFSSSTLKTVDNYASFPVTSPKGSVALERYVNYMGTETTAISCEADNSIRTLQGLEYPDTVTSLLVSNNGAYMNMTGLVDGGTIPAHITNMKRAFYGCTNLRRIRVETVAEGTSASDGVYYQTFYGVSKLDIELYLSSGLWACLRADANLNWNYKFIDGAVYNRIIIIGDSLTGGTYGSHLRNLVPINVTVNESAQGGYTSQQIYDSQMMVDPVKMRLPESIVVIWHGTNGYSTDGYDGVTAKMVAALEGNQRYVLIPPTAQGEGDEVYESWKATYGEEHVLSMGDWFANNGYTVSDYQTDGTHFNADGYALVAQAVYEKIQHWL